MAISKDAELSWVIVVVLPILGLVIWLIAGKGVPLFKVLQIKLDNLNRVLRKGLTGIRVIRAFNRTGLEQKRFQAANHDLTQLAIRINKIMAGMMPAMMLVFNFTTIAIIWFGGMPGRCRKDADWRFDGFSPICNADYVRLPDGRAILGVCDDSSGPSLGGTG